VIIITKRELEILNILRVNPLISQKELAEDLGLTRSSVAVHITNLMKKGLIRGKGYILNEKNYITVIGGSNIDIVGFPNKKLRPHDSNPGVVKVSLGGVGRNIAENISKLGIDTTLLTAVGNDLYGNDIISQCKVAGINMSNVLVLENIPSSTYLSIMDNDGDMNVAISHMDIIDELSIEYIKKNDMIIKNSQCVVIDTNLKESVIEFLLTNYKDVDFFVDTVSVAKAAKVKTLLPFIHTIKPNKLEVEQLCDTTINNDKDVKNAISILLNKGVKNIVVSLGEKGIYYGNNNCIGKLVNKKVKVVNSTGAGDAFMAGLVYGYINNKSLLDSCKISMTASALTLEHESTINPNLSIDKINKILKEND